MWTPKKRAKRQPSLYGEVTLVQTDIDIYMRDLWHYYIIDGEGLVCVYYAYMVSLSRTGFLFRIYSGAIVVVCVCVCARVYIITERRRREGE